VYRYTRANTPGSAQFTNRTRTSIRANWTANGNPSGTQYYCENTTEGTNSGWITATSWNSTGLTCGESYSFRVRARNGNNITTGWRTLGTTNTSSCPYGYFSSITFDPTYSYLIFNQIVEIDFYYYTNGTSNFWIQIHPLTDGSISPGATATFAYQVSSNSGYRTHSFTIQPQDDPPIHVDQIRFRLWADGMMVESHIENVNYYFDTLY
jgi:hypothetical protein